MRASVPHSSPRLARPPTLSRATLPLLTCNVALPLQHKAPFPWLLAITEKSKFHQGLPGWVFVPYAGLDNARKNAQVGEARPTQTKKLEKGLGFRVRNRGV